MIVLVPDNEHPTQQKRLFFRLPKGPFRCKVTPQLYIETVESGVTDDASRRRESGKFRSEVATSVIGKKMSPACAGKGVGRYGSTQRQPGERRENWLVFGVAGPVFRKGASGAPVWACGDGGAQKIYGTAGSGQFFGLPLQQPIFPISNRTIPTCQQCAAAAESGEIAQWILRRWRVEVEVPGISIIVGHRDDGCAAHGADRTNDALADGAEHSGFGNVQKAAQFACADERQIVTGTWKVDRHNA